MHRRPAYPQIWTRAPLHKSWVPFNRLSHCLLCIFDSQKQGGKKKENIFPWAVAHQESIAASCRAAEPQSWDLYNGYICTVSSSIETWKSINNRVFYFGGVHWQHSFSSGLPGYRNGGDVLLRTSDGATWRHKHLCYAQRSNMQYAG